MKKGSYFVSELIKDKIVFVGLDSMEFINDFRKSSFSGKVV